MATVHEVALELYGLPLDQFIATRAARAKEARADGDRDLQAAIAALPKPTAAAWAVNLLVRHRRDEVAQLVGLGELLRAAQAALSGDDLRALNRQQHQVMAAIVRQAAALVSEHGHRLSDPVALQVESTLRAAMADAAAAELVLGGLLVGTLQSTGFEPVDLTGASALDGGLRPAEVPRSPARLRVVPDAPARAPEARVTGAGGSGAGGVGATRPVAVPDVVEPDGAAVGQRLEADVPDADRLEAERAKAEQRNAERAEVARLEAEQAEAARLEAEQAEQAEAEQREAERAEAERLRAEAEDDVRAAEEDEAATADRLRAVDEDLAARDARLAELVAEAAEVAGQIEELTEREHALDLESRTLTTEARGARRDRDRAARAAAAATERVAAARRRLDVLP